MFQTQTRWKLGALLLVAPLMSPAVAQAKDYEQTDCTPASVVGALKLGYKWTGPKGEVYLFRKDGQFEARTERNNPYIYSKDFGRFTVSPTNEGDYTSAGGEKLMLVLKITSSLRKPDKKGGKSKVVQRVQYRVLPLKFYSSRPNNDDRYDPDLSVVMAGDRFTQVSQYARYN